MTLKEIINEYNSIFIEVDKDIEILLEERLSEILKLEDPISKNSYKSFMINSKKDLKKIKGAKGFYLILTDYATDNNQFHKKINDKTYTTVYRGHGDDMKSRLISHMDFMSKLYESTMIVKLNESDRSKTTFSEVRLSFSDSKLYNSENILKSYNLEKTDLGKASWVLITITLPQTSADFRHRFEVVYDGLYKKPLYSKK